MKKYFGDNSTRIPAYNCNACRLGIRQSPTDTSVALKFTFFECKYVSQSEYDLPGGSDGKASAYTVGDRGSIPGLGRSSGEGNDNPL